MRDNYFPSPMGEGARRAGEGLPFRKKRLPVGENQPISPFILVPAYSLIPEKFSLCKHL